MADYFRSSSQDTQSKQPTRVEVEVTIPRVHRFLGSRQYFTNHLESSYRNEAEVSSFPARVQKDKLKAVQCLLVRVLCP